MPFKFKLLLFVFMIGIGILFGTTFHSVVMPFFGGKFFHCIAMGLIYGITSFFVAYYFKSFSLGIFIFVTLPTVFLVFAMLAMYHNRLDKEEQ